jgi:hypothetical protein
MSFIPFGSLSLHFRHLTLDEITSLAPKLWDILADGIAAYKDAKSGKTVDSEAECVKLGKALWALASLIVEVKA